jgi:hypothetical protein
MEFGMTVEILRFALGKCMLEFFARLDFSRSSFTSALQSLRCVVNGRLQAWIATPRWYRDYNFDLRRRPVPGSR